MITLRLATLVWRKVAHSVGIEPWAHSTHSGRVERDSTRNNLLWLEWLRPSDCCPSRGLSSFEWVSGILRALRRLTFDPISPLSVSIQVGGRSMKAFGNFQERVEFIGVKEYTSLLTPWQPPRGSATWKRYALLTCLWNFLRTLEISLLCTSCTRRRKAFNLGCSTHSSSSLILYWFWLHFGLKLLEKPRMIVGNNRCVKGAVDIVYWIRWHDSRIESKYKRIQTCNDRMPEGKFKSVSGEDYGVFWTKLSKQRLLSLWHPRPQRWDQGTGTWERYPESKYQALAKTWEYV